MAVCVQYGGSEAHSTFFQRQRGDWEAATQSRDLVRFMCLQAVEQALCLAEEMSYACSMYVDVILFRPCHVVCR